MEGHFPATNIVRDIVIGMAAGLTVSFPQTAGISGAVTTTPVAATVSLAGIASGSIAIGLGGFLAACTDY